MTDPATTERSPREPFSGVPVRDLVRDVVAVTAMLVGLGLPWTATARGSDRLEVVLATVVAVVAVALPYARRAQLATGAWAADEQRTRWIGLAPLAVVAVVHLVLDVVPGGSGGVGAGLGLGLAGAVLAAGLRWPRTVASIAAVAALGAVAVPVLAATGGGLDAWAIVTHVLTALLVLGVLWVTVGRYERGDQAAGALLVGVGIVLALGAALVGGATGAPWVESLRYSQFGLLLLPVLAAAAAPRVVGQTVDADAQPRLWVQVAVLALELGMLVGAYVALTTAIGLISLAGVVENTLRLVFGVVGVVALFFARRALLRDLSSGHATAVGAVVVVAVLGLVLLAVRAGGGTAVHPVYVLFAFGVPAVVLAVLLVPRSLHELRSQGPASPAEGTLATYGDTRPVPDDRADVRPVRPIAPQVSAAETAILRPVTDVAVPDAAAPDTAAPDTAAAEREAVVASEPTATVRPPAAAPVQTAAAPVETAAPVQTASPAVSSAAPADPAAAAQPAAPVQPTVGPFGSVGATQVLPPIGDVPGSRWSAAHALDPATPLADLALIVQEAPHLRRYVAANPSTYPALLDWLGALGDPEVDAALRARD